MPPPYRVAVGPQRQVCQGRAAAIQPDASAVQICAAAIRLSGGDDKTIQNSGLGHAIPDDYVVSVLANDLAIF